MKKRIQVTINSQLVADARRMMAARGFDSFSEFLESLIRDETDRRINVTTFPDERARRSYPPSTSTAAEWNDKKKK